MGWMHSSARLHSYHVPAVGVVVIFIDGLSRFQETVIAQKKIGRRSLRL
jgi:hypothetical protein